MKSDEIFYKLIVFLGSLVLIPISYLTVTIASMNLLYTMAQCAFLCLVIILYVCVMRHAGKNHMLPLVIVYVIWYGLSVLYNDASISQFITFSVRLLGFVFLVEVLRTRCWHVFISGFSTVMLLLTLANTVSTFLFPNAMYANVTGYWIGFLLGDDNASVNIYLMTVCVCCILAYTEGKRLNAKCILSIVNMVIFCFHRSISAGILCSVILVAMVLLHQIKTFKLKMGYVVIAMGVFFFAIVVFQRIDAFRVIIEEYLNRDATLSSRTRIWNQALLMFKENPLIGYGTFYRKEFASIFSNMNVAVTPHNTYLANLIAGGMPLVAIMVSILLAAAKSFDKQGSVVSKTNISISMLALLLHGQVEGSDTMYILFCAYLIYALFHEDTVFAVYPRRQIQFVFGKK